MLQVYFLILRQKIMMCLLDLLDLFQQQKGVLQARTNLNVFDFTSFMAPYLNNFGNLKNNHMFHIYMGSGKAIHIILHM